jgi:ketosteroid isomerase-like protein
MKVGGWLAGVAAILLAAACSKAPAPMTDAEKTALADSVGAVTNDLMASVAAPATAASVDKMMSHYVRGNDLVHAEYGTIYPTYDSLLKAVRTMMRPGSSYKMTLDQKKLTVLDRDVVVLTAMVNGVFKDSAGKEMPIHEAWMAVYHRTPDGWKIAADHESTAPPAPAPAPAKPARRAR